VSLGGPSYDRRPIYETELVRHRGEWEFPGEGDDAAVVVGEFYGMFHEFGASRRWALARS